MYSGILSPEGGEEGGEVPIVRRRRRKLMIIARPLTGSEIGSKVALKGEVIPGPQHSAEQQEIALVRVHYSCT